MADPEHLAILNQGVKAWNQWRKEYPNVYPNLSGASLNSADLSEANLSEADLIDIDLHDADMVDADLHDSSLRLAFLTGANFMGANLTNTDLTQANLYGVYLAGANLHKAELEQADLTSADLSEANLSEASLYRTNLTTANLTTANLSNAKLDQASLVRTNLTNANLTQCHVFGVAAWGVQLDGAKQQGLIITPPNEPTITVDNLEVAQFIYLLLNNAKLRDVIDTITTKLVLILGRFTPERKTVLDALREALRTYGYVPILFDFDRPPSRDLEETACLLANLAQFVIADITDPSSVAQELKAIIPNLQVPVQPILLAGRQPYALLDSLGRYDWVFPIYPYADQENLVMSLQEKIIKPAEQKVTELVVEKANQRMRKYLV